MSRRPTPLEGPNLSSIFRRGVEMYPRFLAPTHFLNANRLHLEQNRSIMMPIEDTAPTSPPHAFNADSRPHPSLAANRDRPAAVAPVALAAIGTRTHPTATATHLRCRDARAGSWS